MPISGCHNLPLATFNLPSRVASREAPLRIPAPATTLKTNENSPLQNQKNQKAHQSSPAPPQGGVASPQRHDGAELTRLRVKIVAPRPKRLILARTPLPAEKRIQRRAVKLQITTPQMLKQSPTWKASRRIHYAKCVIPVHPRTRLPAPTRSRRNLHRPPESPA